MRAITCKNSIRILKKTNLLAHWSLNLDEIKDLPEHFAKFHQTYCSWMRTCTQDTSHYGRDYINGLIRRKAKRNINNIARTAGVPEQNMQQFISDSPWSGYDLIPVLQQDITMHLQLQEESVLIIDESADEKAGEYSAGARRQHNGRLGKGEMSQVGVFLSLTKGGYHNWLNGELYFSQKWFTAACADKRKRAEAQNVFHFHCLNRESLTNTDGEDRPRAHYLPKLFDMTNPG